jgi:adenosine deaminase
VCPSSNVHTGAVASLAEHPIARMQQAGLSVSCSTDNRLMSDVSLSGEVQAIHEALGLGIPDLGAMMAAAAQASFLPAADRESALAQVRTAWRD